MPFLLIEATEAVGKLNGVTQDLSQRLLFLHIGLRIAQIPRFRGAVVLLRVTVVACFGST